MKEWLLIQVQMDLYKNAISSKLVTNCSSNIQTEMHLANSVDQDKAATLEVWSGSALSANSFIKLLADNADHDSLRGQMDLSTNMNRTVS